MLLRKQVHRRVPSGKDPSDHRATLVATFVTGGATIVVALVGIVRSKALALLVGPVGIGQMGIINSVLSTVGSLACLGLTFSGVRQIAVTDGAARQRVIRLIWRLGLASSLLFGVALIVALDPRIHLIRSVEHVPQVGPWLALGLVLAIIAGTQMTILQGMRLIGALSRVRMAGAVLGVILAVGAVARYGDDALAFAVIAVPLGNVIAGFFARPPRPDVSSEKSTAPVGVNLLLTIGFITMLSGFLSTGWQFLVRNEIMMQLGLGSAGLYQAAYSLSAMNVSLVLTALAADFYPRLSATVDDDEATQKALRDQFSATLILGAPLLLALLSTAPIALHVLFRSDFVEAWPVLQWQALGDLLRLPGWTVAVLLVARAERRKFLSLEVGFALLLASLSILFIRTLGLVGAGIAYALTCAAYSGAALALMPSFIRFERRQLAKFGGLVVGALAVCAMCAVHLAWGVGLGAILSAGLGLFALAHLRKHFSGRVTA